MADIVLTGDANWSTCNGGGAPAAGDSIYVNTFTLTLDGADGATYTCVLIRASASAASSTSTSGLLALGAGTTTCTIDANVTGGTRVGSFLPIASGKHVTVTGTIQGSTTTNRPCCNVSAGGFLDSVGTAQGTNSGSAAITNSGTITAITNVIGGTGTNGAGIVNNGTITAVTNVTGGSAAGGGAHGIQNSTGGSVTATNVTGGSAGANFGIVNQLTGTATVTTAKGGTHASAHGVVQQGTGTLVVDAEDTSGTGKPVAVPGLWLASGIPIHAFDDAGNPEVFSTGGGGGGALIKGRLI